MAEERREEKGIGEGGACMCKADRAGWTVSKNTAYDRSLRRMGAGDRQRFQ